MSAWGDIITLNQYFTDPQYGSTSISGSMEPPMFNTSNFCIERGDRTPDNDKNWKRFIDWMNERNDVSK